MVKGSPVKGIAAMADPPLTFALVVRNDNSIKSLDDLKGKKVGVSTVGSVTGWLVGEIARQKGWGYDGMQLTPIGDDATRVAALKTKSIDGAVVNLAVASTTCSAATAACCCGSATCSRTSTST